ncbi:hypothetical protein KKH23_09700 [Patescibacteria group bacterium]|nr:hypothetical protein [Patescibacteria group bacterium]
MMGYVGTTYLDGAVIGDETAYRDEQEQMSAAEAHEQWLATMPCGDCIHWGSDPFTPYDYCYLNVFLPVAKKTCKRQAKQSEGD